MFAEKKQDERLWGSLKKKKRAGKKGQERSGKRKMKTCLKSCKEDLDLHGTVKPFATRKEKTAAKLGLGRARPKVKPKRDERLPSRWIRCF